METGAWKSAIVHLRSSCSTLAKKNHNHAPIRPIMVNIIYTPYFQLLVVDPALGSRKWKWVELSPAEIRQAVETGATLAKKTKVYSWFKVTVSSYTFI